MDARTALLAAALRRRRIASAAELAAEIGVSQPTLSRLLRGLGRSLVSVGRARRTRYALLRSVRGLPTALPIYRVGPSGQPRQCATLGAIDPERVYVRDASALGWPLDETMREGVFPGVPYFILDMRPQGFLGRAFAREQAARSNLPVDPTRWSDDDVLVALVSAGEDMPGDLIVGAPALEAFQRRRAAPLVPVRVRERERLYPERAAAALLGEPPGSSAGGEFAKFTEHDRGEGRGTACHRQVLSGRRQCGGRALARSADRGAPCTCSAVRPWRAGCGQRCRACRRKGVSRGATFRSGG